jgi:hypothetical protein
MREYIILSRIGTLGLVPPPSLTLPVAIGFETAVGINKVVGAVDVVNGWGAKYLRESFTGADKRSV